MVVKLSRENWRLIEKWKSDHIPELMDWFMEALVEADVDVDELIDQFRAQRKLENREVHGIDEVENAVLAEYNSGPGARKIRAIKKYRELTGAALTESKAAVEDLVKRIHGYSI